MTEVASTHDLPHVVVLMATFNGRRWIDEQVDSILGQVGVDVRLVVSDDGSSDGTREHLLERSVAEPRLRVLPRRQGSPGVTANFLHLFTTVAVGGQEYVAFSDQDDVWHSDKLKSQIACLADTEVDAVSSNVTSFRPGKDGHTILKSQPQRRWDYIFEAAGPGSTYVFTPAMHGRLVRALGEVDTSGVGVHDWFLYALTRALRGRWVISERSTLDYRQHGDNVQGEHSGLRAFASRLSHLRSGFYRRQFLLTAHSVRQIGSVVQDEAWVAALENVIGCLEDTGLRGRMGIWKLRRDIRRSPSEGRQLALACLLGLW